MADLYTIGASASEMGKIKEIGNKTYICAYTALTSLAAGCPVLIATGKVATYGYTPVATAPATTAGSPDTNLVGICPVAITAAGFYWFQIRGLATAYVLGASTIVPGNLLKVTAAGTNFLIDGTVLSTTTCAVAQETYTTTTAALKSIYLTGRGVTI